MLKIKVNHWFSLIRHTVYIKGTGSSVNSTVEVIYCNVNNTLLQLFSVVIIAHCAGVTFWSRWITYKYRYARIKIKQCMRVFPLKLPAWLFLYFAVCLHVMLVASLWPRSLIFWRHYGSKAIPGADWLSASHDPHPAKIEAWFARSRFITFNGRVLFVYCSLKISYFSVKSEL